MKTREEFVADLRKRIEAHKEKEASYKQRVIKEIRKKYSLEDEIALINNYNTYQENNELVVYKQEYDAYQTYRVAIKEKIKEVENESVLDES